MIDETPVTGSSEGPLGGSGVDETSSSHHEPLDGLVDEPADTAAPDAPPDEASSPGEAFPSAVTASAGDGAPPAAELVQAAPVDGDAAPVEGRRRGAARKRRSRRTVVVVVALVVVLGLFGTWVGLRLSRTIAPATFVPSETLSTTTPGVAPAIAWPAEGQASWSIPALGVGGSSTGQVPLPIGSIAKLMTALTVLADHPLALGDQGPSITVSPGDVVEYQAEVDAGQSHVAIQAGEQLSELELLEGLLVHSSNDYAFLLARWDAGSIDAFVTKMNARAATFGLTLTHYADASGYSPSTTSTAAEQITVARHAMADPVIASIVSKPSVTLPVAGSVGSYTPLVGTPGVVGVKSGLTTEAGGCDVMAYVSNRGGFPVMIFSAVMGQKSALDRLAASGQEALRIARAAESGLVAVRVLGPATSVGTLAFASGSTPLVTGTTVIIPSWPGAMVSVIPSVVRSVTGQLPAHTRVGHVTVRAAQFDLAIPLRNQYAIPELSLWQRLG